jgi:hypothetical protein
MHLLRAHRAMFSFMSFLLATSQYIRSHQPEHITVCHPGIAYMGADRVQWGESSLSIQA